MYSVRSRPDFLNATVAPSELTTITAAETLLNAAGTNSLLTAVAPMINVTGSTGSDGRFGDGVPTLHGGDQSNFAMRATATLVIPVTGAYTFHVNSDEGFRLRIDNTAVMSVNGLRAPADSIITRTLSAGNHSIILTYFDNTGGDEVELSAARGTHASFSNLFRLIGDTAEGGLPVLAPTGTGQSVIATDLGTKRLNSNASAYVRLPFTVANPADAATLDLAIRASSRVTHLVIEGLTQNGLKAALTNAIRAVPIGEAMMALVLADHFLRHRGQTGRDGRGAKHVGLFFDSEERRLAGMHADADDQRIDQLQRSLDDVEVALGDRVEGAGVEADTFHGGISGRGRAANCLIGCLAQLA